MSSSTVEPAAPLIPPGRESSGATVYRPDQASHWTLLIMSSVIVLLSFFMSTRGEEQVTVPIINQPLPGLCTTRRFFGLDCPGCGLTRCFISLAHGDVARAWHFNPAGIWFFALVVAQIPYRAWQLWRIRSGREPVRLARINWTLWLLLAALLAQWAVKLALNLV